MTRPWKTLILSMALFQVIFVYVTLDLLDYAVWLNFYDQCKGPICPRGRIWETVPGMKAAVVLGITASIVLAANVFAWTKRSDAQRQPNARS